MKIENCKLKIAKHKGFTLIELLVTMAIVGILAGTAIVNFGKNEDRDVRQEKDRLTTFLREVQNKALAGEKTNINLLANEKLCGFGVRGASDGNASLQTYYIKTSGVNGLDIDCDSIISSGTKTNYEQAFSFSNSVKISGSFSDIFFLSPHGKIYYGGVLASSDILINLKKGTTTLSPAVTINVSGNIK